MSRKTFFLQKNLVMNEFLLNFALSIKFSTLFDVMKNVFLHNNKSYVYGL